MINHINEECCVHLIPSMTHAFQRLSIYYFTGV